MVWTLYFVGTSLVLLFVVGCLCRTLLIYMAAVRARDVEINRLRMLIGWESGKITPMVGIGGGL